MKKKNNIIQKVLRESIQRFLIENSVEEVNDIYNGNIQDRDCPFFNKVWNNGFTIAEMVQYDDPDDRIDYAYNHLDYLGSGIRRCAFKLNDKYVLKLAKGWHRFQTKNEYDTDLLLSGKYDLFPRIIYQSRDFTWTISEYARPLQGDGECEKLLGIPLWSQAESDPSLEGFQLWAETRGRQASREKITHLHQNDVPMNANAYMMNVKYAENKYPCDDIYYSLTKTNPWFKQLFELERHSRGDLRFGTDIAHGGGDFQGNAFGVVNRNGKPTVVFMDAGFIKPFDILKTQAKYPQTTLHKMENPNFGR